MGPFAFWDGMAVFGGKTRDGTVTLINFVDDLVKSQAFWPWLFEGWMTQYVLLTFQFVRRIAIYPLGNVINP